MYASSTHCEPYTVYRLLSTVCSTHPTPHAALTPREALGAEDPKKRRGEPRATQKRAARKPEFPEFPGFIPSLLVTDQAGEIEAKRPSLFASFILVEFYTRFYT